MLPALHLVTNDRVLRSAGFAERAGAVIDEFGDRIALQLRGHRIGGAELYRLAERFAAGQRAGAATVIVNDRIDVALAAGADGVHLGRRSLPSPAARELVGIDAWIGRSVHAVDEALAAERDGADYVIAGTIHPSASHPERPAAGPALIRRITRRVGLPVLAIGGMTPSRVRAVREAGAHGVAVVSGIWDSDEPVAVARRFLAEL